ncbi:MAG TPA: pilin [Syntrophorhabdales bacterium]|nr:pilin [Syntrophorhabdales bacterium]
MKIRRDRKGFTLIELLIVIAIIGILAAIALPAYTGYTGRARVAGVVHSIGAIKTAVSAYFVENGGSPAAADVTAILNLYGIDISTQYAQYSVAGSATNCSAITATIQNVSGIPAGAQLILTPDNTCKTWTWSAGGGLPPSYMPKS